MTDPFSALAFAGLVAVLSAAAISDVRHARVPNTLTYPAAIGGVAYWTSAGLARAGLEGALGGATAAGIGLLAGLLPMLVIFALGGMGGGDVKLAAAAGAIAGDGFLVLQALFYGFLAAMALAIFLMVRHGIIRQTLRRIASAAASTVARVDHDIPRDGPRIPFAVALWAGGLLAVCERVGLLPWAWEAGP